MNPELRKQLFIRKHLPGILAVLILTIMLPLTIFFSRLSPQYKQQAAEISGIPTIQQPTLSIKPTIITSTIAQPLTQEKISPANPKNTTTLILTICLHGIGVCGDNVATQSAGNLDPLHTTRQASVDLYDNKIQIIKNFQISINYSATDSKFTGRISADNLPTAIAGLKISVPGYLSSSISTGPSFKTNQTNILPIVSLVTGDIDRNNTLNLEDYKKLMLCFDKPNQPNPCITSRHQEADLNDDGAVNGIDYNLFIRETADQKTQK